MSNRYILTSTEFSTGTQLYVKDTQVPEGCQHQIIARCNTQDDALLMRRALRVLEAAEKKVKAWKKLEACLAEFDAYNPGDACAEHVFADDKAMLELATVVDGA